MPIKRSAWKNLRKSRKRHQRNINVKSELKTITRKLENFISSKNKSEAQNLYQHLASKLDKAASRNIIHKKTASRKKARLMKRLSRLVSSQ